MTKDKSTKTFHFSLTILGFLAILTACNSHDSDYIPYAIKAMDVWVYDIEKDKNYYGGRVKTNYFSSDSALSKCASNAHATANQYHLNDWSYVCCTVTPWSECVTKVR